MGVHIPAPTETKRVRSGPLVCVDLASELSPLDLEQVTKSAFVLQSGQHLTPESEKLTDH